VTSGNIGLLYSILLSAGRGNIQGEPAGGTPRCRDTELFIKEFEMKSFLTILSAMLMTFAVTGCGGGADAPTEGTETGDPAAADPGMESKMMDPNNSLDGDAPVDGDAPATDGDAPATDGDAPATDGDAPATDGDAPATDGDAPAKEAPATDGDAPAKEAPATDGDAPAKEAPAKEAPAAEAPAAK
jgi:hypothetical protein